MPIYIPTYYSFSYIHIFAYLLFIQFPRSHSTSNSLRPAVYTYSKYILAQARCLSCAASSILAFPTHHRMNHPRHRYTYLPRYSTSRACVRSTRPDPGQPPQSMYSTTYSLLYQSELYGHYHSLPTPKRYTYIHTHHIV